MQCADVDAGVVNSLTISPRLSRSTKHAQGLFISLFLGRIHFSAGFVRGLGFDPRHIQLTRQDKFDKFRTDALVSQKSVAKILWRCQDLVQGGAQY